MILSVMILILPLLGSPDSLAGCVPSLGWMPMINRPPVRVGKPRRARYGEDVDGPSDAYPRLGFLSKIMLLRLSLLRRAPSISHQAYKRHLGPPRSEARS